MIEALVIEPAQSVVVDGVCIEVGIPHDDVLHDGVLIGLGFCVVVLLVAVGEEGCGGLGIGGRLLEDLPLRFRLPLADDDIPLDSSVGPAHHDDDSEQREENVSDGVFHG